MFSWYYGTNAPLYVALVCFLIWISFIVFRFGRMFYLYVKTGEAHSGSSNFMENIECLNSFFAVKTLVKDLYMNTNTDDIFYDAVLFMFASLFLMMLGGVVPYIFALWLIVEGIIQLAKYMRKRVEMKEEFVEKLKGNR